MFRGAGPKYTMRTILLLVLQLLPLALAQDLTSTLESYPLCAQACIIEAFVAQICAPTDSVCICTDAVFQSNVTDCVQTGCSVIEALGTQNTSRASCGATIQDRSDELVSYTFAMFALSWLLVIIRFGYKMMMRMDFGLDDWMLLATALVTIPQVTIFMVGTVPNGLGRDIWTLAADRITDFLKYWYIAAIVYFLQTSLLKLAFISFYMRIFTARTTRRILWATFTVVALWGFSFVMVAIFVCKPISYLWTQWDGLHDGECLSDAAYVWTNAASNIAFDIWILAIPLWEVRKLQLHWKKKLGVALMFGLGAFVTVMSILRLKSLILYQQRDNVTQEFAEVYLWSSIEIGVGIICACLPTIRLLLVKIWPVLSGSTIRDSNQWYRSSNKKSQASTSTSCSSNGWRGPIQPSGSKAQSTRQPGIAVENTFTLQYPEGSDISLILMKPEQGYQKV